jgi:hypothetical protein
LLLSSFSIHFSPRSLLIIQYTSYNKQLNKPQLFWIAHRHGKHTWKYTTRHWCLLNNSKKREDEKGYQLSKSGKLSPE